MELADEVGSGWVGLIGGVQVLVEERKSYERCVS